MDFLRRILIIYFGYLYPAYMCFSALNSNKLKLEQLRTWCRYWIIMAVFTGVERVADIFISWLPFYSGGKLAFIVYLWHPDTKGTDYIYETCMEPFFYKHSQSVDQDWVHFRNQVVEISKSLCNKALLAMQLKLTGVIREHVVTRHPVVQSPVSSSSYRTKTPPGYISSSQALVRNLTRSRQLQPQPQSQPQPQPQPQPPGYHQSLPEITKSLILSHQPKQEQCLASTLVIPKGEHLFPTVTSKDTIADDDKYETDFEILDSSDIPLSASNSTESTATKVETHVPVDSNKTNIHASGFRFPWWKHQHQD